MSYAEFLVDSTYNVLLRNKLKYEYKAFRLNEKKTSWINVEITEGQNNSNS